VDAILNDNDLQLFRQADLNKGLGQMTGAFDVVDVCDGIWMFDTFCWRPADLVRCTQPDCPGAAAMDAAADPRFQSKCAGDTCYSSVAGSKGSPGNVHATKPRELRQM
jgi:hypothetical protein